MKRGLLENIAETNLSPQEIVFNSLPEITYLICSYLTPEEAFTFRQVCSVFLKTKDSVDFDVLLQPLLNRLKVIAPHIAMTAPEGLEKTAWRHVLLPKIFDQISQSQWSEIKHFKNAVHEGKIALGYELTQKLYNMKEAAKNLQALEATDALLNEINSALIAPHIDIMAPELRISNLQLTRIPEQLFSAPLCKLFWNNLQRLNCDQNQILFLPENLGQCVNLNTLNCFQNQLSFLPQNLGQCANLQGLFCSQNKLVSLPVSLGLCANLKKLDCYENQLLSLPEFLVLKLGNDWKITTLKNQNSPYLQDYIAPVITKTQGVAENPPEDNTQYKRLEL